MFLRRPKYRNPKHVPETSGRVCEHSQNDKDDQLKTDVCSLGRNNGTMNFTSDMLVKLTPQERLLLQVLYERVSAPPPPPSEWPWTMRGPATEAQAFKARRGVPSPQLTAGRSEVSVPPLEERASSVHHGSPDASPAQHQSTPSE